MSTESQFGGGGGGGRSQVLSPPSSPGGSWEVSSMMGLDDCWGWSGLSFGLDEEASSDFSNTETRKGIIFKEVSYVK